VIQSNRPTDGYGRSIRRFMSVEYARSIIGVGARVQCRAAQEIAEWVDSRPAHEATGHQAHHNGDVTPIFHSRLEME
jgi:hypothetical protein